MLSDLFYFFGINLPFLLTDFIYLQLKCYVIRVDVEMNKLLLSLKDPLVGEQNNLEIGHPYKLKVKQCKDDGLAVKVVGK
jgi:Ribosomal protein S1